jgi:adenosylcobinamide amidohydrolase
MKIREVILDLEGTKAGIIYHLFRDMEIKTFLLSFAMRRRILSTLEGFKEVKFVGNHYNPPQLWDFVHRNKREYEEKIFIDLGFKPKDVAMLFTGVDMDNISIKMEEFQDIKICACVTAGIKSNAQRIGVDKAGSVEIKEGEFQQLGTVNIILLTNASLTDGAMARSIITITEAKTLTFQDLDIRSSYNPKIQATGTGTDNIIVVPGFGPKITYVGGHAKMGEIMARAVSTAVREAIFKQNVIR